MVAEMISQIICNKSSLQFGGGGYRELNHWESLGLLDEIMNVVVVMV